MYTIYQLLTAAAIAAFVLFLGRVSSRVRVKVIHNNGRAVGLGVGTVTSLHLNQDMADFDKQAAYETDIKPHMDALHDALNKAGISGMAVCTTASDRAHDTHATRGCCAFLGPNKTTDEMMIAYEFVTRGLERGSAALMAVLIKEGKLPSEQAGQEIFLALAKNGLNAARREKGLPEC